MSVDGVATAFPRLLKSLPRTRALPPEVFAMRHRVVIRILVAHAVGLAIFGFVRGYPLAHVLLETSVVGAITIAAAQPFSDRARALLSATGLVTSSAILVHLSGGTIEAHFHFFVILGLMTLYHDWTPYLVAFGYVVLHHGVLGVLDPIAVYDHAAARENPWLWAAIHGAFVLAACMVQIFSWRTNEMEHERAERFRLQLQADNMQRRQALQINDEVLQGLVVAKLAASLGDRERAEAALDQALGGARTIISDLLGDRADGTVSAGMLVRDRAATVQEEIA